MILLDTHVVVWLFNGDVQLGTRARDVIETASDKNAVLISPICFLEAAMLVRKDRIALPYALSSWTSMIMKSHGVQQAGLTPDIAIDAGSFGREVHGDPVDRILIATARALNCPLMTADGLIHRCAKAGHLQAIDARI